jgi:hypothetical protein
LGASASETTAKGLSIANVFVENIWVYHQHPGYQGPSLQLRATFISNKCIFGSQNTTDGLNWPIGQIPVGLTSASINYTLLQPTISNPYWWTIAHVQGGSRTAVSLNKVAYGQIWWDPPNTPTYRWTDDACTGVYALDDKAVNGTAGYGPDYGAFRITQGPTTPSLISVSQPIGDIIRLRRNENNVPLEDSTGTLKNIAQLIGQTGIRLRRNFSNIPGE